MSPSDEWWCVELERAAGAARPIGHVRAWQDVLDRAAAIRRLGDTDVPGYTGLYRIRFRAEAERYFLVSEGPGSAPQRPR